MKKNVFVKTCGIWKDFLAVVTHEIVLFAVGLEVDIKGVGVGEYLVADMTCLQSLT